MQNMSSSEQTVQHQHSQLQLRKASQSELTSTCFVFIQLYFGKQLSA